MTREGSTRIDSTQRGLGMKKYIMVIPYIDGVASSHYEATAADIAEAHPKCHVCDYKTWPGGNWMVCGNVDSPMENVAIDLSKDYCRHHSELTKEHDDDKSE